MSKKEPTKAERHQVQLQLVAATTRIAAALEELIARPTVCQGCAALFASQAKAKLRVIP